MLRISKSQWDALGESARKRFELRMVKHLHAHFPKVIGDWTDERLLHLIRFGIDRAEEYSIVTTYDVSRYIEHMLIYGPNFDTTAETEWAAAILQREDLGGTKKMDRIDDYDFFAGSQTL